MTCLINDSICTVLCQLVLAAQNALRQCSWTDTHAASAIRMFTASSHNLNRMSEFWFYLQSFPSLFCFIPTSSYCLFLTLQLLWGSSYFLCFIPYLNDQSVLFFRHHLVPSGMCHSPLSLPHRHDKVCINVVCCLNTLYSTHLLCSWRHLQAMSANVYVYSTRVFMWLPYNKMTPNKINCFEKG